MLCWAILKRIKKSIRLLIYNTFQFYPKKIKFLSIILKQEIMKYFLSGGAGFIGSNLVHLLLKDLTNSITIYDNFITGKLWHLKNNLHNERLNIIKGDIRDIELLEKSIVDHDIVYHFAANADIASAVQDPSIDFVNGTLLTFNVLEAMRKANIKRIFFTSGSGVYGEVPPEPVSELFEKMIPISTYGASKLSSESMISAYCFMFDFVGTVFRFANIVGPNQTHGVSHDFVKRLKINEKELTIYGDGNQSKPYIHVNDVIKAFILLEKNQSAGYDVFNVGSEDFLTVNEIADIVCEQCNLIDVKYLYTGGTRGWKGDVPVYRLNTAKIRSIGWNNSKNSKEAVVSSVKSMLENMKHYL